MPNLNHKKEQIRKEISDYINNMNDFDKKQIIYNSDKLSGTYRGYNWQISDVELAIFNHKKIKDLITYNLMKAHKMYRADRLYLLCEEFLKLPKKALCKI